MSDELRRLRASGSVVWSEDRQRELSAGEVLWFAKQRTAELEAERDNWRGIADLLREDWAEAKGKEPRWIPVGERLPTGADSLKGLLVVSQGSKPREAWFDEDMGWTNGECIPLDDVALWMTMPEGLE